MTRRVLGMVGTKGPFPRLVEALARIARETDWQIRVQHAGGTLPAPLTGWPLLPREAMLDEIASADAVVCHAGSGAIRDALAAGHRPIVVPRLERYREHVNDHQRELAQALGTRVIAVEDLSGAALAQALMAAIARAHKDSPRELPGDGLRRALQAEVEEIAATPTSRRARLLYRLCAWAWPRATSR